jgi:GNAT superfamily N-acetyltransferase
LAYLDFFRCPGCGHCQESICWSADNMATCYGCDRQYPKESFGTAKVKRVVAECQECGSAVSLTPRNFCINGIGWMCSKCGNYVAVTYGVQAVQPGVALNPKWNPTIRKRADPVDRNIVLLRCRTKKDFLIVRLLQLAAKAEDPRFMFVRGEDQEGGLYFDTANRKYLGFIVCSEDDEHAVLRQIFIVPEERRKGLAEKLVTFWVKNYADRLNTTFGIEAPNEIAMNLHIKLGHAVREGGAVRGLKCFFAPSM